MARKAKNASFDPDVFLSTVNHGRAMSEYRTGQVIFAQGDAADSVFYVVRGKIKIAVTSEQGREAVVGLLDVIPDGRAAIGSAERASAGRRTGGQSLAS